MWSDKSSSESARIGRYWDARVAGGDIRQIGTGTAGIEASLADTIARLERIDDAQHASREFARRFEAQFLAATGATVNRPAAPGWRLAGDENSPLRMPGSNLIRLPVEHLARRRTLAAIAAAVMITLAIAAFYYAASRRDDSVRVADNAGIIPAPSIDFDVPMDRGNPARSGVMPGPGVSSNLQMRWSFDAGRGSVSAPALVGDTMFLASGSDLETGSKTQGSVVAIDASNGAERWRFPTEHPVNGTPAVDGGVVYAADTGGVVYAIDASTGEELWRQDVAGGWTSSLVVIDDAIFVATAPYRTVLNVAAQRGMVVVGSGLVGQAVDGVRVIALDSQTGDERWHTGDVLAGKPGLASFDATNGDNLWSFELASLESGPAISGQQVFAASTVDRAVYALDLETGSELWQTQIGEDLPQSSSPAVSGGDLFITTAFGRIICIDAKTGSERWQATAEHMSLNSSAIVVDNVLYIVDTAFGVSAFSIRDGTLLWSETLALTGQVVDSPIVSNGNLLIVTSLEGEQGHVAKLWVFAPLKGGENAGAADSS